MTELFKVYDKTYTKDEILENIDCILNSGLYYTNFGKDVKTEHIPVILTFENTKLTKDLWKYIQVFQLFYYKNGRAWALYNNKMVSILDVKETEDDFWIQVIDPSKDDIDYVFKLSTFKHTDYLKNNLLSNMTLFSTDVSPDFKTGNNHFFKN